MIKDNAKSANGKYTKNGNDYTITLDGKEYKSENGQITLEFTPTDSSSNSDPVQRTFNLDGSVPAGDPNQQQGDPNQGQESKGEENQQGDPNQQQGDPNQQQGDPNQQQGDPNQGQESKGGESSGSGAPTGDPAQGQESKGGESSGSGAPAGN